MLTVSREQRRDFLETIGLFAGMGERGLDRLAEMSSVRTVAAEEVLCHKGDEASQLYGVLAGRLKAVGSSGDGREVVFSVIGPGEVTGEIALVDGQPRSAAIVAMEECVLLVLARRDFLAYLREDSEAAIQLAQALARYIRRLSDTVEDAYYHRLPVRLAKKLLALGREHGEPTPQGLRVRVRLSQRELGELVGKTREAVNKQLRAWAHEGIVETIEGHLVLRDVDRLEDVANGG